MRCTIWTILTDLNLMTVMKSHHSPEPLRSKLIVNFFLCCFCDHSSTVVRDLENDPGSSYSPTLITTFPFALPLPSLS